MKRVEVTFNTLTPIYFGDASQKFTSLRPSEILGCMRFWLDVACVCGGLAKSMDEIESKSKSSIKIDEKIKENLIQEIIKENNISWDENYIKKLAALRKNASKKDKCGNYSDLVFGAEGTESQIRIVKIDDSKENHISIERFIIKINNNNSNERGWPFPSEIFFGKFTITFEVKECFLKPLFYPLLNFINEFGYLGGRWNLGLGRVEVVSVKEEPHFTYYNKFDFEKFGYEKSFTFKNEQGITCVKKCNWNEIDNYNPMVNRDKLIKIFPYSKLPLCLSSEKVKNYLEERYKPFLIGVLGKKKVLRNKLRGNDALDNLRHTIFGTSRPNAQGSKLLPYVKRDSNDTLEGCFLSLADLYDLKGGEDKNGTR